MHAACGIIIVCAQMTVLCNVKSGHDMGCGVVNACRVDHYWAPGQVGGVRPMCDKPCI